MINTDLHHNSADILALAELKNNFAEILKHDLKTPVIAQIRILELLLSGHFGKLKVEQSDILISTLDSCKYLYKTLSDIISAYKTENKDFESVLFAQKIENKKETECYLFFIKESAEKRVI